MHRPAQGFVCLWGVLLLGLAGCAVTPTKPLLVRRIFVEEASGAPSPELALCAAVIHDTSVRVLQDLGYVASQEPAEADAFLHAAWTARPATAGTPEGRVSLRVTMIGRDGAVMKEVDVIHDARAGFLTRERIADQVRAKLGSLSP
jgi:hypothetical protein